MHFYFQSRYLLSLSFALICSNIYMKLIPLSIKIFQPNHLKLSTLELQHRSYNTALVLYRQWHQQHVMYIYVYRRKYIPPTLLYLGKTKKLKWEKGKIIISPEFSLPTSQPAAFFDFVYTKYTLFFLKLFLFFSLSPILFYFVMNAMQSLLGVGLINIFLYIYVESSTLIICTQ